jgi:Tol biopolymer transport system component
MSTQLTTNGESALAAISSDGKYLASIVDDNGKLSLWLRHILTNSDTQVIPPAEGLYVNLAFSPDGSYIYFSKATVSGDGCDLFRVPVLGGPPQILVKDIDSNLAFSPGGGLIAFVRANNPEISIYRLIVANADGTEEKIIASRPYSRYPYYVAWSSDGKRIFGIEQSGAWRSSIVSFDVASGQVHSLAAFDDLLIDDITPTLDEQKFMVLRLPNHTDRHRIPIGLQALGRYQGYEQLRHNDAFGR